MDKRPICSVVVVAYNSRSHLEGCLNSLLSQTLFQEGAMEVIVVDNSSDDGSPVLVRELNFDIILIQSKVNLGYAGGNNLGFKHASGEYLAVMNPDCVAAPDCFEVLTEALQANPDWGLVTPKAFQAQQCSLIDTCGLGVDVNGYGVTIGQGKVAHAMNVRGPVPSVSGSCFLARRQLLEELEGFDESFFLYVEEVDLSFRARLLGYQVGIEPSAVVWHDHKSGEGTGGFYYLERNRYQMLAKILSKRSLLFFTPALLVNELGVWSYAATRGPAFLSAKLRSVLWLIGHMPSIVARRREVQANRVIDDRQLLEEFIPRMPLSRLSKNRLARIANQLIESVNRKCLRVASQR